jgi:hypothetical protein
MKIHNRRDFNAGLMFIVIGLFFLVYAQDYSMGTANRMGPAFFPTMLSGIMLLLGLIVLVMAFLPVEEQEPPPPTDWRGFGLVLAGVFSFAVLLPVAGFLITVLALVGIAAAASHESKKRETVFLATGLVILGVVVFGYGLELQFPILPPFFTR